MERFVLVALAAMVATVRGFEVTLYPTANVLSSQRVGDALTLTCDVTPGSSQGTPQFSWAKDGQSIDNEQRQLEFGQLTVEHSGTYECSVSLSGDTKSDSATLTVFEEVRIADTAEEQHAEIGTDGSVECSVQGSQPISIAWTKDGRPLTGAISLISDRYSYNQKGQVLIIAQYNPQTDDGIYECKAQQISRGSFDKIQIHVHGYSKPTIEVPVETSADAIEGKQFELVCSGSGIPAPAFLWYQGDVTDATAAEPLSDTEGRYRTENDGKLVIEAVQPADEGVYTCLAHSQFGTDRRSLYLTVFKKPSMIQADANQQIAAIGSKSSLECEFFADKLTEAYWTAKGEIYKPMDTPSGRIHASMVRPSDEPRKYTLQLHIDSVQKGDADEYQCFAYNKAGSGNVSTFLQIEHAPAFTSYTTGIVRAWQGASDVRLFCEVEAAPPPAWQWLDGRGEPVPQTSVILENNGMRATLLLAEVRATDYGNYTCVASNSVDQVQHTVAVVEIVPPPRPSVSVLGDRQPNYAVLAVHTYDDMSDTDANRPAEIVFNYKEMADQSAEERSNLAWGWFEPKGEYILSKLRPATQYEIRVAGANEAGVSEWSDPIRYMTDVPKAPAPPIFVTLENEAQCDDMCTVEWTEPNNHGSPITNYRLSYAPLSSKSAEPLPDSWLTFSGQSAASDAAAELDASQNSVHLAHLRADTWYAVRLTAVNELGASEESRIVIKTPASLSAPSTSIGVGVFVVIIVLVLVGVLCLVDLVLYAWRKTGMLMFVCVNCLGRPPRLDGKKANGAKHGISMEECRNGAGEEQPLNGAEAHRVDEVKETTPLAFENGSNGACAGKTTCV